MIKRFMRYIKNNGTYSEEHFKFLQYIKGENEVQTYMITSETIKKIDTYIRKLEYMELELLEESLEKRNKDIELDLTVFVSRSISIAALIISLTALLVSMMPVWEFVNKWKTEISIVGIVLTGIYLIPVGQTFGFYFKRKEELLFNSFLLRRINKCRGTKKQK